MALVGQRGVSVRCGALATFARAPLANRSGRERSANATRTADLWARCVSDADIVALGAGAVIPRRGAVIPRSVRVRVRIGSGGDADRGGDRIGGAGRGLKI